MIKNTKTTCKFIYISNKVEDNKKTTYNFMKKTTYNFLKSIIV